MDVANKEIRAGKLKAADFEKDDGAQLKVLVRSPLLSLPPPACDFVLPLFAACVSPERRFGLSIAPGEVGPGHPAARGAPRPLNPVGVDGPTDLVYASAPDLALPPFPPTGYTFRYVCVGP